MTPTEIIGIVDRITPNAHTSEDKLRWLKELDNHLRAEKALLFPAPAGSTEAHSGDCDALEAPAPFAEELYTAYLQACMAWADEEDARYDRFITRFNDAYSRYMGHLIQTSKRLCAPFLKF